MARGVTYISTCLQGVCANGIIFRHQNPNIRYGFLAHASRAVRDECEDTEQWCTSLMQQSRTVTESHQLATRSPDT